MCGNLSYLFCFLFSHHFTCYSQRRWYEKLHSFQCGTAGGSPSFYVPAICLCHFTYICKCMTRRIPRSGGAHCRRPEPEVSEPQKELEYRYSVSEATYWKTFCLYAGTSGPDGVGSLGKSVPVLPEAFLGAQLARIHGHPYTLTACHYALSSMQDSLTFAPTVDIQPHSRFVATRNDYETLPLNCASYQVHTGQLQRVIEREVVRWVPSDGQN